MEEHTISEFCQQDVYFWPYLSIWHSHSFFTVDLTLNWTSNPLLTLTLTLLVMLSLLIIRGMYRIPFNTYTFVW